MLYYFYLITITGFFFTFTSLLIIKEELHIKLLFLLFSLFIFLSFGYFFLLIDFSTYSLHFYNFVVTDHFSIIITIAIDQISIIFIFLTSFIFFIVALVAWNSIKYKVNLFFVLLLILEFAIINVFLNFDLLFFYVWYESSLIPIFYIILIWGNPNRKIIASFYLMFYTLVFSIFFFIFIIFLHYKMGSTSMLLMSNNILFNQFYQNLFFLGFFFAFAVKVPLFPMHIWLPEAHVESPTVGSIVLASLLLKLGYYGFLRICLPYFYDAIIFYKPILNLICFLGCLYGSLLALSQSDIKKIVAYSSVSHMGLCILGLFSFNIFGVLGSFLIAVSHSFVSSALFYLVGILYERYHTRSVDYFSGLSLCLPGISGIFFLFVISNFSFPISLNFIAEFFIFLGIGSINFLVLVSLLAYSVLTVSYNLLTYMKIFHGTLKKNLFSLLFMDIQKKEVLIVFPLLFLNVFFCFFPSSMIKFLVPSIILLVT